MYIYIIGVTTSGLPDTISAGPTLGCFSSKKKAYRHIEIIKQDRLGRGGTILWDIECPHRYSGDEIRRVMIDMPDFDGHTETLRLEKWEMYR